jgi:hypothetical protein
MGGAADGNRDTAGSRRPTGTDADSAADRAPAASAFASTAHATAGCGGGRGLSGNNGRLG